MGTTIDDDPWLGKAVAGGRYRIEAVLGGGGIGGGLHREQ